MLIITHPLCLAHDAGETHPEQPERLRAVLAALRQPEFAALQWQEAMPATREQLGRVHNVAYLDDLLALRNTPQPVQLDSDTLVTRHTIEAALLSAGAAVAAVDAVLTGQSQAVFCATRPPGHHAEPDKAMGFCYFSNLAVAAAHALAQPGIRRVALLDFDVHHGNGTQAWAETEPRALFCSSHEMPLYPGTGWPEETGAHNNCLNVALPTGADSAAFHRAWAQVILPRVATFAPDMLFVSAGFDAHAADPLAGLELTAADYTRIAQAIAATAAHCCAGRVVSVLEGGYNPPALAESVSAYVRGLQG